MDWDGRKVLVTGEASFIGSHLANSLIERGDRVRVVDDLSGGRVENIRRHLEKGRVDLVEADLKTPGVARQVVQSDPWNGFIILKKTRSPE